MKIGFDISIWQLAHVNDMIALNLPTLATVLQKRERATYHLIDELAIKLLKKAIDKRQVKKFKVVLKYYEAFALHEFLLWYIDLDDTDNRRQTREILAILNQKLT